MTDGPLRIALLSYRGHPHVGGQGIYVRYLSTALAALGHRVEVFAGPPYPDFDPGVVCTPVSSLDLYRPEDPFRRPALNEFKDGTDALEYGLMCTGAFPEPLTFSLRVARLLRKRRREFDVVHDNQSLGYGLLHLARMIPMTATIHHPISIDRVVELEHARSWKRRVALRRWYSFTKMQQRVARRLRLIAVSESTRRDVVREWSVPRGSIGVVHNGVDSDFFRPLPQVARHPGCIITTASADAPMKGQSVLIEAVAKLRTERDCHLVVVGGGGGAAARALVARFGIEDTVTFTGRIDSLRLVELYAQAHVAAVPSLYEGFSLPAVEAMSSAVPLAATTGGALPEVIGPDGECGRLVAPGDAGALAGALGSLLDDDAARERMGAAGRRRVLARFTWRTAAARTVEEYRDLIDRC